MLRVKCAGGVVVLAIVSVVCGSVSAETITDDFNDGVLGPHWQVVRQTDSTSWNESNGTLNLGGSAGQTGELILRYREPIADVGTVRVDYNWVSCTGHKARVFLGLWDASWHNQGDALGVYIKGIRYSTGGSLHAVDGGAPDDVYKIAYSVPASGSLRIERDDTTFRASYVKSGSWQVLFETQHDFGGTPLYPYLFTSNSDSNPSWQVALDNFSADVVPEPTVLVLLAVGALAMTFNRHLRFA